MPELSVGERLVCLVNFAANFVFEMHWVLKLFFTMCEGTLHIAQNKYGKFNPFFEKFNPSSGKVQVGAQNIILQLVAK